MEKHKLKIYILLTVAFLMVAVFLPLNITKAKEILVGEKISQEIEKVIDLLEVLAKNTFSFFVENRADGIKKIVNSTNNLFIYVYVADPKFEEKDKNKVEFAQKKEIEEPKLEIQTQKIVFVGLVDDFRQTILEFINLTKIFSQNVLEGASEVRKITIDLTTKSLKDTQWLIQENNSLVNGILGKGVKQAQKIVIFASEFTNIYYIQLGKITTRIPDVATTIVTSAFDDVHMVVKINNDFVNNTLGRGVKKIKVTAIWTTSLLSSMDDNFKNLALRIYKNTTKLTSDTFTQIKKTTRQVKFLFSESFVGSGIVLGEKKDYLLASAYRQSNRGKTVLENTAVKTYRFFNNLLIFNFGNNEVIVVEEEKHNELKEEPQKEIQNVNPPKVEEQVKVVYQPTNTIVERVIQATSGVTPADLQKLKNELLQEIYRMADKSTPTIYPISNYAAIAHTNKIDQLNSVTINSSAISGGTISGATITNTPISGSTGSFTILSVSDSATIGGQFTANSASTTQLTVSDRSWFTGLASFGNATTSNLTVTGILYDSDGEAGISGQVLSTTATGTSWTTNSSTQDSDGDTMIQAEESADEDKIRFDTAGTERMVIDEDGKIGIATTSPLSKLTIFGDVFLDGANRYLNFGTTTATSSAGYGIRDNLGTIQYKNLGGSWADVGSGGGSGTVTSVDMTVPTGLSVSGNPITTSGTLALTYSAGYEGLKTASSTNWNTFYDTPSNRITAGTGLSWSTNTLNAEVQSSDLNNYLSLVNWYATTTHENISSLPSLSITESQISDLDHFDGGGFYTYFNATNTDALSEGSSNLYYTDARARSAIDSSATGLTYTPGTGIFSLTPGYNIPLTASTTNWNNFYDTPSGQITAGTNISWSSNTLNVDDAFLINNGDDATTGQLTAANFVASSGTATSTFAGGLNVGSGGLIYDYSSGKVGIGTDSPVTNLEISSNETTELRIGHGNNWNGALSFYEGGVPSWSFYNVGNGDLFQFNYAGTGMATFEPGGDVGIGTTSPFAKLSVAGNGYFDGNVTASIFTATSTSATSTFPYFSASQSNLGTVVGGIWNGSSIADAYVDNDITASNYLSLTNWFATTTHSLISSLPNLSVTESQISDLDHYTNNDWDIRMTSTTTLPSITTLANLATVGTIGSGVWNGTAIGDTYLTKTGNWTGTFDGQEGSYYLDADNLNDFDNPFYTYFNATNTDALSEGSSNFYATQSRWDSFWNASTTLSSVTSVPNLSITESQISDLQNYLALANWYATTTDGLTQGSANLYNQTHTGEVTGSTALTIANNIIDEANLKLDTSPTDNYILIASSTASGGMDWVATSSPLLNLSSGGGGSSALTHTNIFVGNSSNIATATSSLVILDNGNIGIGTTSPLTSLSLEGTAGTPIMNIANSTGASALYVDEGGDIGIGMTAPTSKFHVVDTLSAATGDEVVYSLNYTTNKATSGNDTGLQINMTDTASPGTSYLIDARVGGTSKFWVDSSGNALIANGMRLGSANASISPAGSKLLLNSTEKIEMRLWGDISSGNAFEFKPGMAGLQLTGSSGVQSFLSIIPEINQSGTAGYNGIFLNVTETGIGSGPNNLIDLQVDSSSKFLVDNTGNVGIGTTSPYSKLSVWGDALGNIFEAITNSSTTAMVINAIGDIGIGVTDPDKKLEVFETVADAQVKISYDATRYANLQVDSVGDLIIDPQGNDLFLNDDNLFSCTGGSCPAGNPTGTGNIVVENKVGIGTTTPAYKLSIETQDSSTNLLQIASSTNQNIFTINSDGDIAIGTSSPFARFSIGSGGAIVVEENTLIDGATITVDWRDGNQQDVELGGNRTINFSNYTPGQTLRLLVCQDSTGSRTVTWDSNIDWNDATAPTLTTTADKCDVIACIATEAKGVLDVFCTATLNF